MKKSGYPPGGKMILYLPVTIFLLVSLLSFPFTTFAQNTDFSGTWKFNESKSIMGERGRRGTNSPMTVTQDGNVLTTERIFVSREGEEMKTTETFTLDGKECDNSTGMRTRTTTVTWSEDGTTLTFNSVMVFNRQGETMEMKSKEIWKLSDGGKILTIDSSSQSPMGERTMTLVYEKQ
ncbi:MAG: hypothetical protein JSV24_03595 [Bacteroidales bacterium]|nr:MAG: hypothetical protein JSV24_03595 [Bacteroidales bacterium]